MKAMYKYELARAAGVSEDTFRKWCRDSEEELAALGCRPRDQLLNPAAADYLCRRYCIIVE